ncbi:hypothetical protein [Promineifilum sp.]|uniref:hypothetical protein n=1 Tax=Promineifilum sp. TaxID=2664178 RepID=UPI0035B09023
MAEQTPAAEFEDISSARFDNPTRIDNKWLPLKPGTQFIYMGTVTEDGETIPFRLEFTVTDLIKEIAGVDTVVAWILDYSDGELVEKEISFYAQDNDGNVWYLGEHPAEYEDGNFVTAPTWIHGFADAQAGIIMTAKPEVGSPSFSQGWSPSVDFMDRGQVAEMGQETCVFTDCYKDVLIVEEFTLQEPGMFQLKYYAPGVGNVRVGWKGSDESQEELELVDIIQLDPEAMAQIREAALQLEKEANEFSPDIYGRTTPMSTSNN